ncbi:hypothetical protein Hanom_Chr05g00431621 [Helianthus anomalus]
MVVVVVVVSGDTSAEWREKKGGCLRLKGPPAATGSLWLFAGLKSEGGSGGDREVFVFVKKEGCELGVVCCVVTCM